MDHQRDAWPDRLTSPTEKELRALVVMDENLARAEHLISHLRADILRGALFLLRQATHLLTLHLIN
jgi:hypothetical protein